MKNFTTEVSKVKKVSNVSKVATNERVDGVERDGEEWYSECETKLDILTGSGCHSQELVSTPSRVMNISGVSLKYLSVLFWAVHCIANTAGQKIGEELKSQEECKWNIT